MFICDKCGKMIDDDELSFYEQGHAYGNHMVYERLIYYRCTCGGELAKATQCKVCGEWFDDIERYEVCDTCFETYETVSEAIDVGNKCSSDIEGINGFVASVLSVEQINKILTKWVEENFVDKSTPVVKYLEYDKWWFAEHLEEKYKNEL